MDFERLNRMLDELNENFNIVETQTKKIEQENLNGYKDLFFKVLGYLESWVYLFRKVSVYKHNTFAVRTNGSDMDWHYLTLTFGDNEYDGANMEIGTHHIPMSSNNSYYDSYMFKNKWFVDDVVPSLKSIDYDYVEKQMMEKLNKMITIKAERIEKAYQKAIGA